MKFKRIVPFFIFGAVTLCNPHQSSTSADKSTVPNFYSMPDTINFVGVSPYFLTHDDQVTQMYLDRKADALRDEYVANMLAAQEKLAPLLGTRNYNAAVRRELPGAPVGKHCVYGQYTQLNRALESQGDTITIIPNTAKNACYQFKHQMREKYPSSQYPNCIRTGRLHESDSTYNAALAKYLAKNKITTSTPDSIQQQYIAKFAQQNYSADSLDAGAIMIVPRTHGSNNQFHAIMFLGRGRIQDDKFIPDSLGRYMYTGHNREIIGDLFQTWDMSNVFTADTRKIVRAEYAQELEKIQNMSRDELVNYLAPDNMTTSKYLGLPHHVLIQYARDKYFNGFAGTLANNNIPHTQQQTPVFYWLEQHRGKSL